MTMVNNVIGAVNYVIAARTSLRNYMIADNSICSLAAPSIQRPSRWPARDLGDKLRVRVAAPDPPLRTVPLVPVVLAEHAIAMSVLTHLPSMACRESTRLSKRRDACGLFSCSQALRAR
jgi:hypothetical protein